MRVEIVQMTMERKLKFIAACEAAMDALLKHVDNPVEALACLNFMRESLIETIGGNVTQKVIEHDNGGN